MPAGSNQGRPLPAAVNRRQARVRFARRTFTAAVVVAVLRLVAGWLAGPGAADVAAGFACGVVACAAVIDAQRARAERWARRVGLSARAAANRPVAHRPKPARTPIHDSAVAQKGSES